MASRLYRDVPPVSPGQVIGLYGGSFNPAHEGHRKISATAIRRLGLSRLWWLVSPGNPLKSQTALAPYADRLQQAACVADNPQIDITGLEMIHDIRYTVDLVDFLIARRAGVRFVWIMGGDNLAQFHRWLHWRQISDRIGIAVINRPGWLSAVYSPAGHALAGARIPEAEASNLAFKKPPAWVYLTAPRAPESSTAIRNGR